MAVNYTEAQVKHMVAEYSANPTRETVENLADELEKSIKSIIGKLSREGVYKKTEYTTKTGEKPITKIELVEELAELLELETTVLAGLEKAPKTALKALREAI
jgi:N-methylhydantoinase B/oxoprolinase/acetone carboxylase alpha subunit|tara:strand:- start:303 stop:611 length:309 start_codon:yes stop_codon:yes gene_type:complete